MQVEIFFYNCLFVLIHVRNVPHYFSEHALKYVSVFFLTFLLQIIVGIHITTNIDH